MNECTITWLERRYSGYSADKSVVLLDLSCTVRAGR